MNRSRVGVVVVAYRSAPVIGECLDSILADPHAICVVVDNASDDATAGIVAAVANTFSERVTYVAPGFNVWYAGACNFGVNHLPQDVDYIAIVNPDVRLEVALSQVVTAADLPAEWTIISGCLTTGGVSSACGNARPLVTLRREIAKAVVGSGAYRRIGSVEPHSYRSVGQLDGALLVLRMCDWVALGGFDERFELYYEDVDLCARAASMEGCWLVGQRWGFHEGGASFSESGGRAFVALRVSRVRYLRKWFGLRGVAVAPIIAVLEWVTRTLCRCPESSRVRLAALGASLVEIANPGRITILDGGRL